MTSPSREDSTACSSATPWPYSANTAEMDSTASGSAETLSSSQASLTSGATRLDDAVVAAVDRHLCAGGLGEERATHGCGHVGHVATGDFHAQDVVALVLVHRQAVALGAAGQ